MELQACHILLGERLHETAAQQTGRSARERGEGAAREKIPKYSAS
jgi:hypothetical protein